MRDARRVQHTERRTGPHEIEGRTLKPWRDSTNRRLTENRTYGWPEAIAIQQGFYSCLKVANRLSPTAFVTRGGNRLYSVRRRRPARAVLGVAILRPPVDRSNKFIIQCCVALTAAAVLQAQRNRTSPSRADAEQTPTHSYLQQSRFCVRRGTWCDAGASLGGLEAANQGCLSAGVRLSGDFPPV